MTNTTHRRNDLARDIFLAAAAECWAKPAVVQVRDGDSPGDSTLRFWRETAATSFYIADAFIAEEAARNPEPNILDQMGHKP